MIDAVWTYWREGGWLLLPIAFVCFGIGAYTLRLHAWLGACTRDVLRVERELDRCLCDGRTALPAGVARLLPRVGVWSNGNQADGSETSRRAFEVQSAARAARLRRELMILRALVAAAPLLGLLGTVFGMVDTFAAVSTRGADTAPAVAGGISAALITTQFGLVAALPGVFGLVHLHRMQRRWVRARHALGRALQLAHTSDLFLHTAEA